MLFKNTLFSIFKNIKQKTFFFVKRVFFFLLFFFLF